MPGPELMDALIRARQRGRPRDIAVFLVLRYTGMRRESVATLRVRNVAHEWGFRGVIVKGGKTRDISLPDVVTQYLEQYIDRILTKDNGVVTPDAPLFWSSWGRPRAGRAHMPMTGRTSGGSVKPTAA